MLTNIDPARAAFDSLITSATTLRDNLQPVDEGGQLPGILAAATGDRLDLLAQAESAIGAHDHRAQLNRLTAGAPAIPELANAQAAADAVDAVKQALANYGQSIRDLRRALGL